MVGEGRGRVFGAENGEDGEEFEEAAWPAVDEDDGDCGGIGGEEGREMNLHRLLPRKFDGHGELRE